MLFSSRMLVPRWAVIWPSAKTDFCLSTRAQGSRLRPQLDGDGDGAEAAMGPTLTYRFTNGRKLITVPCSFSFRVVPRSSGPTSPMLD